MEDFIVTELQSKFSLFSTVHASYVPRWVSLSSRGLSLLPKPTFSLKPHSVHFTVEPDSGLSRATTQHEHKYFFSYTFVYVSGEFLRFNKTNLQRCKTLDVFFFPHTEFILKCDADEQWDIWQKQDCTEYGK